MVDATVFASLPDTSADSAALLSVPTVDAATVAALDGEPITLQQAKDHLRVVDPDEDGYISGLIVAARQMAEGRLNRTLVQRQRTARFGSWGDKLVLLKPPAAAVNSISYVDETGAEMVLDASRYYLAMAMDEELDGLPEIELYPGQAYPALDRRRAPITVSYTAGYPVGQVPAPIVQWMLLSIGTMYDNRASVVNGVLSVPLADDFARWLLQPFMVYE